MNVKYQIFVSSTYEDLKEEREQVIKAILEMGHIPVGMEMFSAADDEQWKIITRQIDDSDYYVIIAAHRYGSTDPHGLSYTEKEYDYALKKGVPALGFLINESASWSTQKIEKDQSKLLKLNSFKAKIKSKMVNFWDTKNDLHAKVSIALMKSFTANPRTGWIRANETVGPAVTNELTRLSSENAELRYKLNEQIHKSQDDESQKMRDLGNVLISNEVLAYVRQTPNDWGKPIHTTLSSIFEIVSVKLVLESSTQEIASQLALGLSKNTNYYRHWPVPENFIVEWIADLSALDLIEPSKKKHALGDNFQYWTLTDLGRRLFKDFRRYKLELALERSDDSPEASEKIIEPSVSENENTELSDGNLGVNPP
jgi:DNA-binding PadR family transcriptional regulator